MTSEELDEKKTKFYYFKYKKIKIVLGYCNYKNFNWHAIKKNGGIILYINNNCSEKFKSKLLHKAIRNSCKK